MTSDASDGRNNRYLAKREFVRRQYFDGAGFILPKPRERIYPTNDIRELRAIMRRLIAAQQERIKEMRLRCPVVKSLDILLATGPRSEKRGSFSKFIQRERNSFSLNKWRICCLHLGASFEDALKGIEILTGALATRAEWNALMASARKEWDQLDKKHGAEVNKRREHFIMKALKNSLALPLTK